MSYRDSDLVLDRLWRELKDLRCQLNAIGFKPTEPCKHAWHCERCGRDGPGMAELRAEWDDAP